MSRVSITNKPNKIHLQYYIIITNTYISVEPNSLVCTDGWVGYGPLSASGYEHTIVRKSADLGDNLLPLVNRQVVRS